MKKIMIHAGCGARDFGSDWIHIDRADFPHIKYKDVTNLSQFKDNSVDLVYASHLICYFDREEIKDVLKEWHRVLKPGGTLRLATPDFDQMIRVYNMFQCELEDILGPLYGKWSINGESFYHKTTYGYDSLREVLLSQGFADVKCYDWRKTEHSHIDDHSQAYLPHMDKEYGTLISLNVEATK